MPFSPLRLSFPGEVGGFCGMPSPRAEFTASGRSKDVPETVSTPVAFYSTKVSGHCFSRLRICPQGHGVAGLGQAAVLVALVKRIARRPVHLRAQSSRAGERFASADASQHWLAKHSPCAQKTPKYRVRVAFCASGHVLEKQSQKSRQTSNPKPKTDG